MATILRRLGRCCPGLQGADTLARDVYDFRVMCSLGATFFKDILNYTAEGEPFVNRVVCIPIGDFYLGMQVRAESLVPDGTRDHSHLYVFDSDIAARVEHNVREAFHSICVFGDSSPESEADPELADLVIKNLQSIRDSIVSGIL